MNTIILLFLSLFVFVSTEAPSAITIDLVASQTITTGTNVEVKLSVLAATNGMVLKTLSGLTLKKDASTSVDLTCTIASTGIACTADTAATVPCTATLSAAGTYSLAGTATLTGTESDGSTSMSPPDPSLGSTTATVNAASETGGSSTGGSETGGSGTGGSSTGDSSTGGSSTGGTSTGGSDTNNGSKFMEISFLLLLFGFLF